METENSNQQAPEAKALQENTQTWEENRQKIADGFQNLMKRGIYPTKALLARETGLSRTTIYKHWNNFNEKEALSEFEKIMKMMKPVIGMKVFGKALEGDLKAIEMYNEMTDPAKKEPKINNNFITIQNNSIHITLNKEMLQTLPTEMNTQFNGILKFLFPDKVIDLNTKLNG